MVENKVFITGGSGLIGSCFLESNRFKYDLLTPDHGEIDIVNRSLLSNYIKTHRPDFILHLAAYRNATAAEEQRNDQTGSVWLTNVEGTRNIIYAAKEVDSFLIHISTDMVFAGTSNFPGPYDERTKPIDDDVKLSWYGVTKRSAEMEILNHYKERSAIIRIGNITNSLRLNELDYVGKIVWLFNNNKLYPLFNDQYVTLTYVQDLIEAVKTIVENEMSGIFHISSSNLLTPVQMAEYVLGKLTKRTQILSTTSIEDFLKRSPNRYPHYSGLTSKYTRERLQLNTRSWQDIVDILLSGK